MNRWANGLVAQNSAGESYFSPFRSFYTNLPYWKGEILALHRELRHLSGHFTHADLFWSDFSTQILATLLTLKNLISGASTLLNEAVSAGHEIAISPAGCEMVVLLCFVDEQINLFLALSEGQISIKKARARQLEHSKLEGKSILSGLIENMDVLLQNVNALMIQGDQQRFREHNHARDGNAPPAIWDREASQMRSDQPQSFT